MNKREAWVAGVSLLRSYLRDDLALARAIRNGDWHDLAAASDIAQGGLSDDLALTDPMLYRALRDAITRYHLRGYGCLDRAALWRRAEQAKARASSARPGRRLPGK